MLTVNCILMKIFIFFLQMYNKMLNQYTIPMNKSELARYMKEIENDTEKYEFIKKYCIQNTKYRLDYTRVFEDFLHRPTYTLVFRVKVLQLMNQIMINQQGRVYIRHFITRIKAFLHRNSMEISSNEELNQRVIAIFLNWKATKFFLPSFFSTLRLAAGAIITKNSLEINHFTKYNKTFTMGYRDIHKVDASSHLYKSIYLKEKANSIAGDKIGSFNDMVDLSNLDREDKVKAREMLQLCNKKIAALVEIINEEQEGCKCLAAKMVYELNELSMDQEMLKSDETISDE